MKLRYFFLLLIIICAIPSVCISQPVIEWSNTYGGSKRDYPLAFAHTTNGSYIIAGSTESVDGDVRNPNKGGLDFWIVKLYSDGEIQWQKTYGRLGDDIATTIYATKDGGYIIAGATYFGPHENFDALVVKIDSVGNKEWEKAIGGSKGDEIKHIEQIDDGGYIAVGYTRSADGDIMENKGEGDYWILKLTDIGQLEWQRTYGGDDEDEAMSFVQTNNGYVIAGSAFSENGDRTEYKGSRDVWLVKVDKKGTLLWEKSYGGTGFEHATSIKKTTDSGFVIVGITASDNGDVTHARGDFDAWIIKTDSAGKLLWEKTPGDKSFDDARDVYAAKDGSIIMGCVVRYREDDFIGSKGKDDFWIVKLNSEGETVWHKLLGGSGSELICHVSETDKGGTIAVGSTTSYDGDVGAIKGVADIWVVALTRFGGINELNEQIEKEQVSEIAVSPNPADTYFSVYQTNNKRIYKYEILNYAGKTIAVANVDEYDYEIKISTQTFPSGLYTLLLYGDDNIYRNNCVIMH